MKRVNSRLMVGIVGLVICSAILLIADHLESKFDISAVLIPFIVLVSTNRFRCFKYVKK